MASLMKVQAPKVGSTHYLHCWVPGQSFPIVKWVHLDFQFPAGVDSTCHGLSFDPYFGQKFNNYPKHRMENVRGPCFGLRFYSCSGIPSSPMVLPTSSSKFLLVKDVFLNTCTLSPTKEAVKKHIPSTVDWAVLLSCFESEFST